MLKRLLLGLCGLFAIAVILFMIFGAGVVDNAVRRGVTTYGPRLTQTTIDLGDVQISPFSGKGSLHDLVVGNPEGFSSAYAIRLQEAAVAVEVKSLLSDTAVIERIYLNAPLINLERAQGTTNLQQIQRNIEEARPQTEEESEPSDRKFIVREFVLEGGRVTLSALGSQTEVAMPAITLEGIGEAEGGVSGQEVGKAILDAVIRSALSAAGRQAGDLLRNPEQAEETLRGAAGRLQRALGGSEPTGDE